MNFKEARERSLRKLEKNKKEWEKYLKAEYEEKTCLIFIIGFEK